MKIAEFFSTYFNYIGESEAPIIYHRWAAIGMMSAILARNVSLPFGNGQIYPQLYLMLIGDPGTRKSTAIKESVKLMRKAEFKNVSIGRTSPEKFIVDLEEAGAETLGECSQLAIVADEFVDFAGIANDNFISLLTTLFDSGDSYVHRLKNSKSIDISYPTVSILSGCTHSSFAAAFPPTIIGGGMLSRMLLVYATRTGKKIAWPTGGNSECTDALVELLRCRRLFYSAQLMIHPVARTMLREIYESFESLPDKRLEYYSQRRHTQLLKLCTIIAGIEGATVLDKHHIIWANTLLRSIEFRFGRALGEFGSSKNSELASKIMNLLEASDLPVRPDEIWTAISTDADSMEIVSKILSNLKNAKKVVQIQDGSYLPVRPRMELGIHTDFSLLSPEERPLIVAEKEHAAQMELRIVAGTQFNSQDF